MTLDLGIHIGEVIAIVFWIGVSWGDVKWIKQEIRHLREVVEGELFNRGRRP